jgi:hypothetical protein
MQQMMCYMPSLLYALYSFMKNSLKRKKTLCFFYYTLFTTYVKHAHGHFGLPFHINIIILSNNGAVISATI